MTDLTAVFPQEPLCAVSVRTFTFRSCVPGEKLFAALYLPEGAPRAVLQIAHGMAEHSGLYEPLCRYFAERGFAVAINDHLGHGKSISTGALYGHFGDEGGLLNVVEDLRNLQCTVQTEFPDLPYFLLGHSMGSFLAREFAASYGASLSAAVFMGTGEGLPGPVWKAERAYLDLLKRTHGGRAHLPHLAKIATGGYNLHFRPNRGPYDWVTSKPEEADRFDADPLCGFPLTVQGYIDLGTLLQRINTEQWYARVPQRLPILLVSGKDDPVGGMGKGVERIAKKLRATDHRVTMKLYPNVRHALHTEVNSPEVFADLYGFLSAQIKA